MRWILIGALAAASASADPEDEAVRRSHAQTLKDEGTAALAADDATTALERFVAAYRTFPSANLLYDEALALEKLGRDAEAFDAFTTFVEEAPTAPAEARSYAMQRISAIAPTVSALEVVANVDGATVAIDGRAVGLTPLPRALHVAPGAHEIRLRRTAYRSTSAEIELAPGQSRRVSLELAPARAAEPSPQPTPPPISAPARRRPWVKQWWLWTTVGAVVTGTVIGLAVGLSQNGATPHTDLGEVTPKF